MEKKLRILILEDVPADAELVEHALRKARVAYAARRVSSKGAFQKQLKEFFPDLILSDYSVPGFDGMAALRLTQEQAPDTPFIIVTGSMNEEIAVECMKAGANDYVIKQHLAHLGPAVKAALEKQRLRLEKELADVKLRESEERYRELFENTADLIQATTPDGRLLYVNQAWRETLGYTEQEIPSLLMNQIVHPEQRSHCIASLEQVITDEQVKSIETMFVTKDGKTIYVEGSIICKREAKTPISIACILRNVTEQTLAEQVSKRAEEENRLLLTFIQTIAEAEDFNSALAAALRMVSESTAWDFGEAWIPSSNGTYLELSSSWFCRVQNVESFRRASERFTFALGVGLPGRVWSSKKPAWIPDVTVDANFPRLPFAKEVGFHAAVGIPILANSDVVAVICFYLRQLRQEDERMVALVSAVAAQLGTVFERKRAEEELQKIGTAIEQTADCVIITDKNGIIQYVNPAFTEVSGYSREEALGKTPRILKSGLHPPEFYESLWKTILSGEAFTTTFINRRKDGELFYEVKTITPIKDKQGNITNFVSTAKEITEQHRAEEALRKKEEHHKAVIESIFKFVPEGVLVLTESQNLLRQNKAFDDIVQKYASLLGYTEQELAEKIVEQLRSRIVSGETAEIRIPKRRE